MANGTQMRQIHRQDVRAGAESAALGSYLLSAAAAAAAAAAGPPVWAGVGMAGPPGCRQRGRWLAGRAGESR